MTNKKSIYINLIVKNLEAATKFYEAIGCTKNPIFSNDIASAMMWSEDIIFMLLTEEFALNFNDGKEIADQKKTVSAFYALGLNSKEAVDEFCEKAKSAGGRVYVNKFNQDIGGDFMYTFEVEDMDGYILEPAFMDMSKFSQ
jgi:predicted lactoylglutathione lyase